MSAHSTNAIQPLLPKSVSAGCALGAGAALLILLRRIQLFSANYLPHRFCYLAQPGLIWTNVAMDGLIALAYAAIFGSLIWIAVRLRGIPGLRQYLWIFVAFGLFIIACGATHSMEIVTVWWPVYPLSTAVKILCAAASIPTAILFARVAPSLETSLRLHLEFLRAAESQRDRALQALQLSEEQINRVTKSEAALGVANQYLESFRLLVDGVAEYAVFMLDPEGCVTTWNLGAKRIKGYAPADIIGKHFSIFFSGEEIAADLPGRELAEAIKLGHTEKEGVRVRSDGSTFWAHAVTTALHDRNGKLVGFGKVVHDLTERRKAEEAVRESNRQLNSVLECTSDSIMAIDRDWSISYGNSRAISGLPDFQIGKNYWECFPAVLGQPQEKLLRDSMDSRVETSYEAFYEPYATWYRVRIFPSDTGITSFFCDITAEKHTQEQLAAEQAMREERILELSRVSAELQSVMDSTSNGIIRLSADWTILYGNRVATESLPDFRLGCALWECFPGLRSTHAELQLRTAMRDRVDARYEMIYAPYAEWFRVHAFPDGDGLSLFFSNITSEKTLEDQLNEERLLREKRIEALSHMAGGLAHEISNPLAIIYARASDLKASAQERPVIEAEEVLKACESIVQTSDRAIKILRGLKGFAREAAKDPMEWASIYDIVEQCVDLQAARFERHRIDLRTNLAPALPLLLCRETQVGQIVTNLLNNAFDAIDQHDCTVRWVEVSAVAAGEMLELEVVDSGPGIDEQARAHLMEPFFTTKPRGLGLGVGLSLSRAIAQEHNGSLILCDDLSHTRFRLRLPFDPDTAANPQAVAGGVYQA